ncbi:MAG TPA: DMT family transporter [Novosphingobium sp.]|nr:DMT family transporter [Novosphingobium sp.]
MAMAITQTRQSAIGIACGIGAGALWGLVFLVPELARDFGPLHLAAGRYLAYGAIAAVLLAPRWARTMAHLTRRDWLALSWLGLLGNTLYYVLLASAVQMGGIAMTSLVIGFIPVLVTVAGSRDAAAPRLAELAPSLLLGAAAAVFIGWQAAGHAPPGAAMTQLAGLLCAIGALVSWAVFAVANSRCLARVEAVSAHDWSLLLGIATGAQAVLLVPAALLLEPQAHAAGAWLRFGALCLGVALFASVVGNALWNRMSRLLPLTLVGQMILFETLFALLYAFVWEQRLPAPLEVLAVVFVVASVVSCLAAHRPAAKPSAPARRS